MWWNWSPRRCHRAARQRLLREKGIGVRVAGSKGWLRKYRPKYGCHLDCMCDRHEGVTDRKMSRAVAKRAARREIKEQLQ